MAAVTGCTAVWGRLAASTRSVVSSFGATAPSLVQARGAARESKGKKNAADTIEAKANRELLELLNVPAARPRHRLSREEENARCMIAKEFARRATRQNNKIWNDVEVKRALVQEALSTLESLGHPELLKRALEPDTAPFPLEAKFQMDTPPGTVSANAAA